MTDRDPGVVPMLAYADGIAALEWLPDVFGFQEQMRMLDGDHLSQAAMDTEFGRIMLASGPPDYEGPRPTLSIARLHGHGRLCPGSSTGCWFTSRISWLITSCQRRPKIDPPSTGEN